MASSCCPSRFERQEMRGRNACPRRSKGNLTLVSITLIMLGEGECLVLFITILRNGEMAPEAERRMVCILRVQLKEGSPLI